MSGNSEVNEQHTTKKCFFITPIGTEDSIEFKKLNALLDNIINPILEEFQFDTVVAHTIDSMGSIGDQVFKSIIECDLILANLTGLNPNVMYETAVAHSFGKPTIMFAEKGELRLPFDLVADRVIFFNDSIEGAGKLKDELRKKINNIINHKGEPDNPITRVLNRTAVKEELVGKTDINSQILNLILDIQDELKQQKKVIYSRNIADEINMRKIIDDDYKRTDLVFMYEAYKNYLDKLGKKPSDKEFKNFIASNKHFIDLLDKSMDS